jgi:hypothetical protein
MGAGVSITGCGRGDILTIELQTRTVFHCICRHPDCKHQWDTFERPKRCAGCKRRSWNGEDYRRNDPYELVPKGSAIDGAPPDPPSYKKLLDTLTQSKGVIDKIIADVGPRGHKKQMLAVRSEMEAQIEVLQKYIATSTADFLRFE